MRPLEPVGKYMWGALKRLGIAEPIRERLVLNRWAEIVGPLIAQSARPLRLENGILWVAVKSHTWAQELQFQAPTILERLNKQAGKPLFRALRFAVRTRLPVELETPEKENPLENEIAAQLRAMTIEPTEQKAVEESIRSIQEPTLKNAIRRVQMAYLKLNRWRIQQGWRPCTGCGALHNESQPLCFLCRKER